MNVVYAASLLLSTAGMVALDVRFALVFRRRPVAAGIAVLIGVLFFIAWDAVGIALDVFRHVDSRWASGLLLAPQFPIEELLFLLFLSYLTLILLSGGHRLQEKRLQEKRLQERRRQR